MCCDEAAIYSISSFLVNCTNRPILPGRKWQKIVKLCIFRSLSTRSHKLGIKTLTLLLTATDCWETMRRFNIMAIQGTFCPFKGKSKTKFQKGFLVSKSFSFSICFCRVYRVFFFPPFKISAHPILFGSRCCAVGSFWFSNQGTYYLRTLSISINANAPLWVGQLLWLLQGNRRVSTHSSKDQSHFCH